MTAATDWIDCDSSLIRENFDRRDFSFQHRLASHPLFERKRLIELTRFLEQQPGEFYVDLGVTRVGQRWDEAIRPTSKPSAILEAIEQRDAWLNLRRAELDPAYHELLHQCLAGLRQSHGSDWGRPIWRENAIIFITSPRRLTPYHIDRECNFILQVHGHKTVYVFDQTDREVLPEEELERFWAADNNAAQYRSALQDRAHAYHLRPGDGVHIPVNAPHWVQNGDETSVTLSVNFQFTDNERANTYRTNYFLRKMGLQPEPPGRYPLRDKAKADLMGGALWLWRHLKGSQPWDSKTY